MKRTSKRWSESEIEQISKNIRPAGRSIRSFSTKKVRLGLREKRKHRPKWSEENLKTLRCLVEQGYSAKKISEMGVWDQSRNSIQKMMCRLGIAKKNKVFKFPMEVKQKFKNFLLKNWEGKTPRDLMELWNRENSRFPSNKSKVVHYLTVLGIKISYGEVQKINVLRKKEELIRKSGASVEQKIKMERIKMMQKRVKQNKDIWTGVKNPEMPDEE